MKNNQKNIAHKKLGVKLFLDFDENDRIIADAKFCYGEEEFNPLQQKIEIKYPRDVVAENKAINMFRKTGFMYYAQKSVLYFQMKKRYTISCQQI